jgi:hypothetical protein
MKPLILTALIALSLSGCAVSPLSPRNRQDIENQNGKIEDLRNNQNGFMLDLIKMRNEQQITAGEIKNLQQGLINQNNENSGIQIFQGDGGLLVGFGILVVLIMVIAHYRSQAVKNQKTAEILAQQIALYDDADLDNEVFMAALNSEVEEDIYHLIVKHQLRRR